jgi:hypothetical protein
MLGIAFYRFMTHSHTENSALYNTDVHAASIFRVKCLKMEAAWTSEALVSYHSIPVSQP